MSHSQRPLRWPNRQSPIASAQRARSTLASHPTIPRGTNHNTNERQSQDSNRGTTIDEVVMFLTCHSLLGLLAVRGCWPSLGECLPLYLFCLLFASLWCCHVFNSFQLDSVASHPQALQEKGAGFLIEPPSGYAPSPLSLDESAGMVHHPCLA